MPTDAQLKEKYEAYLRGEDETPAITASDRVEERIRNTARAKQPVDFELSTMIENIPDSAEKYVDDIVDAVTNPIDTAEGLAKAAVGGVQKLIPGEAEEGDLIPSYEAEAEAVGEHFASRYGGFDEF